MDAILSRLPDAETFSRLAARWGDWVQGLPDRVQGYFTRNAVRLAGFAAGALATLMLGLLFSVIYTGHGAFSEPPMPETVVYPNF